MVNFQFVSDLHLEKRPLIPENVVLESHGEVIALLGDIGSPYLPGLAEFIAWCSLRFVLVLFVPGNHEYQNSIGKTMTEVDNDIESICSKHHNVIFMRNMVVPYKNIMFIGSTLWTHLPPQHHMLIKQHISDYKHIWKTQSELIQPEDINKEHATNRMFIEHEVSNALKEGMQPVVLTHHPPSKVGTSMPQFKDDILQVAYSSQISFPEGMIKLWCAGHTHHNYRHDHEGYLLVSNQYGYGDKGARGYDMNNIIRL